MPRDAMGKLRIAVNARYSDAGTGRSIDAIADHGRMGEARRFVVLSSGRNGGYARGERRLPLCCCGFPDLVVLILRARSGGVENLMCAGDARLEEDKHVTRRGAATRLAHARQSAQPLLHGTPDVC